MYSYVSAEARVPQEHPLRAIRTMVDQVLVELPPEFDWLYAPVGRPSIAPEKLLRALLLQVLYTVRSERLLMEHLDYNLLFRWFVGLYMDDPVWDATALTWPLVRAARAVLPAPLWRWLRAQHRRLSVWPPVGWVLLGSLRRLEPISRVFGTDRGQPIDRYYIEQFLSAHASDIRGHVLEVGDDAYTRKFGGERVTKSDVLHAVAGNPKATIVADLTFADNIPSGTFDCIILTQTLQVIYDVRASLRHLYRVLKPGGLLLATFPGISQISRYDMERWGDYWRFTTLSTWRLFEEVFPPAYLKVQAYGNVLAATAFLYGLATQELRQEELDHRDTDYEVLITVKAAKPEVTF